MVVSRWVSLVLISSGLVPEDPSPARPVPPLGRCRGFFLFPRRVALAMVPRVRSPCLS